MYDLCLTYSLPPCPPAVWLCRYPDLCKTLNLDKDKYLFGFEAGKAKTKAERDAAKKAKEDAIKAENEKKGVLDKVQA